MTHDDDNDPRCYARFQDTWGHWVRVIESSAANYAGVYIFTEDSLGRSVTHDIKGTPHWEVCPITRMDKVDGEIINVGDGWNAMAPHLNPAQVRTLIKALRAHLARAGEPEWEPDDPDGK